MVHAVLFGGPHDGEKLFLPEAALFQDLMVPHVELHPAPCGPTTRDARYTFTRLRPGTGIAEYEYTGGTT